MIWLFWVLALIFIIIRFKSILEDQYFTYLEERRYFSKVKGKVECKSNIYKNKQTNEFIGSKKQKILHLGLFTSNIIEANTMPDNDDTTIRGILQENNKASISLFKVPELYIDRIRRYSSDSFRLFIGSIYESSTHFPKWKLYADRYFSSISTRLDQVQIKYLEFWTKKGLIPRDIRKQVDTMEEFKLSIELRSNNSTDVYTGIRWRSEGEKQSDNEDKQLVSEKQRKESDSVIMFLKQEWAKSNISDDFILINELKLRYTQYCNEMNIPSAQRLNLVGSTQIEEFGAKYTQGFLIPYVKGIKIANIAWANVNKFEKGIVRIPVYNESKAYAAIRKLK